MGTPEFAVPSLDILVKNGYDIVAVITAPDKPSGRGLQMTKSDVKVAAEKHGLKILQPPSLKAPGFVEALKALNANLQIVVAFRMLPEMVWAMPEIGTFNLHGSLLPQYRGAAPINWAIINGEKETGVTTFFLKHEIDTGSILFQEKETISADDDAGSVYQRLMHKGAALVLKTVKLIEAGDYDPKPQDESGERKHAPKLFRENCMIDWNKRGSEVVNLIRGLSPYPAAWTSLAGKNFKVYKAVSEEKKSAKPVGSFETDDKSYLHVFVNDGFVSILELQPEGKKRMKINEFLMGNKLRS